MAASFMAAPWNGGTCLPSHFVIRRSTSHVSSRDERGAHRTSDRVTPPLLLLPLPLTLVLVLVLVPPVSAVHPDSDLTARRGPFTTETVAWNTAPRGLRVRCCLIRAERRVARAATVCCLCCIARTHSSQSCKRGTAQL